MREISVSEDVERLHTGYWFSSESKRFFSSRVAQTAYKNEETDIAYFVSSEQFDSTSPRLYTVRACDLNTGDINTVGVFQEYSTSREATREAQRLAEGVKVAA
ncbi:unnamed protein product [marine sediment metagenome]|uniref:Uncharacterized protein n=1 Tax=marine sediment metagenome TaxID=412755 RepID=X0RMY4_9ZZZZ